MRNFPAVVIPVLTAMLAGCGAKPAARPALPTALPAAPLAQTRQEFVARQQEIAAQQAKQAEREKFSRGFVAVKFHGFDAKDRIVVAMTNIGDKDIDDIRGGIHATDAEGHSLAASGYTEAVPGSLFLAAGQTLNHAPFLSERPKLAQLLRANPSGVVFSFAAQAITYADRTEQTGLQK